MEQGLQKFWTKNYKSKTRDYIEVLEMWHFLARDRNDYFENWNIRPSKIHLSLKDVIKVMIGN